MHIYIIIHFNIWESNFFFFFPKYYSTLHSRLYDLYMHVLQAKIVNMEQSIYLCPYFLLDSNTSLCLL